LACTLHAPVEQVHPSLHATFFNKAANGDDAESAVLENDDVDPGDTSHPGDASQHSV
jgi:hypothetical protein